VQCKLLVAILNKQKLCGHCAGTTRPQKSQAVHGCWMIKVV
jgi:hypothetical protein